MMVRELDISLTILRPGRKAAAESFSMEEGGFRTFYENTASPLWTYLYQASGSSAAADDLMQESYFHLLRAANVPQDELGRRKYLFRIATNLVRDRWRRRKREITSPLDHEREPRFEGDLDAVSDLRNAFDRLNPRERQILWLAYVEDYDHREIAALTGLRHASIRILLFRARHKLAGILRGTATAAKEGSAR